MPGKQYHRGRDVIRYLRWFTFSLVGPTSWPSWNSARQQRPQQRGLPSAGSPASPPVPVHWREAANAAPQHASWVLSVGGELARLDEATLTAVLVGKPWSPNPNRGSSTESRLIAASGPAGQRGAARRTIHEVKWSTTFGLITRNGCRKVRTCTCRRLVLGRGKRSTPGWNGHHVRRPRVPAGGYKT